MTPTCRVTLVDLLITDMWIPHDSVTDTWVTHVDHYLKSVRKKKRTVLIVEGGWISGFVVGGGKLNFSKS